MLQDFKLVAFEAVARSGSFQQSAHDLGVTQSAVSQIIADLEKETGRKLFERRRSGAVLTAAGQVFLALSQRVTDSYLQLTTAMDAFGQLSEQPEVSIFVTPDCMPRACSALLPALRKALPGLSVELPAAAQGADVCIGPAESFSASEAFDGTPLCTIIRNLY